MPPPVTSQHGTKGLRLYSGVEDGTLYIGVTSDFAGRLLQHQTGTGSKFVARYGAMRLVWFDEYDLVVDAIAREKVIKKWPRAWKIKLIEERNLDWQDISWHLL